MTTDEDSRQPRAFKTVSETKNSHSQWPSRVVSRSAIDWAAQDRGGQAHSRLPGTELHEAGGEAAQPRPSGDVGPLLGILGALVHNIDTVPPAVGNGKTEPEGHHDDGDNP